MQVEATYENGRLGFTRRVRLKHARVRLIVDIPDDENLQEDVLPRTHSESATEQPAKGSVHSVTDDIDAILGPWRDRLATLEPITKQDCVAAAGVLTALPNSRTPRPTRSKPLILDPRHAR